MYGSFNIASLLLGLIAWALPVAAIACGKNAVLLSSVSFALSSLSLLFQIFYTQHLVEIRDWSAIEDTHYAVVLAAAALLIGAALLNAIAIVINKLRRR